jgi:hypothetical protein
VKVTVELDSETAAKLAVQAARQRRGMPSQAAVEIRRALGLKGATPNDAQPKRSGKP